MPADRIHTIAIVGARGYAGAELITLIDQHPSFRLAFAASRSQQGNPVPGMEHRGLTFVDAEPATVGGFDADAIVLAVPDGASDAYATSIAAPVVLDLSSDHRFDPSWAYGLTEHNADSIAASRRISNPGCYATAVQLALRPLLPLIVGTPGAFGVSGYSGAGTTPSPRNDPSLLAQGVTPYKLAGHTHEREIARHLARPVRFSPHVAPFFRGITVTVQATLARPTTHDEIETCLRDAYTHAPLIRVLGQTVPRVQDIAHDPGAEIGGITIAGPDDRDLALVCTIDNLLKGAASQAIQNLNLAFGLPADLGLHTAINA